MPTELQERIEAPPSALILRAVGVGVQVPTVTLTHCTSGLSPGSPPLPAPPPEALPRRARRCLLQRFCGLACSVALLKLLRENKS